MDEPKPAEAGTSPSDLAFRVATSESRIGHLDRSVTNIQNEQTRQGTVLDGIATAVSDQRSSASLLPQAGTVKTDSILKVITLTAVIIGMTCTLGWKFTNLIEANNTLADTHSNELSKMRDVHSNAFETLRDNFRVAAVAKSDNAIDRRLDRAMDYMEKTYNMARDRAEATEIEAARLDERIKFVERLSERHHTIDSEFAAAKADIDRLLEGEARNQPETVYTTLDKRLARIEAFVDERASPDHTGDTPVPGVLPQQKKDLFQP